MSRPHIEIQKVLIEALPGSVLEHPFPPIGRIADVVYFPKKLIFEVQCSPISLYEVQKRNRDYASLGFNVIWILHDHIFNKGLLTPAEFYLRQNLAYYASMTRFGQGTFYDQLDFYIGLKRVYRSSPHTLESFLPKPFEMPPFFFPNKLKKKGYYLPGDTVDFLIREKKGGWARKLEKNFSEKKGLRARLSTPYYYLLKRAADRPVLYTPAETENKETPPYKGQVESPLLWGPPFQGLRS